MREFGCKSSRNQLVILALVFLPSLGFAQSWSPDIAFSGFGTLGYAVLDHPNAEYRTGRAIDGADNTGSFEVDTRLGLQTDIVFTTDISSTFQIIAREAEDGDAAVGLEWGFVRWLATDNIAIRAGRMSLPVYAQSDVREVGFSIPYLRPAEDLYSMIPLRRFNGADVTLEHDRGNSLFRWQLLAGQSREELFDDLTADVDLAIGISLMVENGPARIRFSHLNTEMDIDSDNSNVAAIRAGIAQTQQQLPALTPMLDSLATDFAGKRVALTFNAISLNLEFARLFIDAEYTSRRVDNWVSDVDGLSLAVGTRFGAFQPYVYGSLLTEPEGDRRINLPDSPALDPLEAGINQFYAPRDQITFGVGARYDISPNFALKVQVDRIQREEIGISFNRNSVDDGSDDGMPVTLLSVVVDFVF